MPSILDSDHSLAKAMCRARLALSTGADFIASLESDFRRAMSITPAEALGCSDELWQWIALCRRPRDDRFSEDIHAIAAQANVDPKRLQNFIVVALTAARFRNAPPEVEEARRELLAARERSNPEE